MKILYVSQYFPPEMGAPAARAAELSRHWAAAGHEVTVLTGFPNHPTGIVPPEYRDKFRYLIAREQTNGVNIVRTWLLPFPNRKAYKRMLNYGSFCASAASTGLFLERPDVVIATSPQLLVGLSGWWLARCKRAPFVFEVRDLWPESLAAVGMGNQNSLLHRALAKLAGFLYRHSDRVVVVTPAFEDYLVEHWRVPRQKISVVENGVETHLFAPKPATALRRELGAEGKFVVSYIGTMGMAHGLETIIAAATKLRDTNPDIVFLMLGEGADKDRIVALTRERGLNNLRFVDQQPREKIPAYINSSDACLVLLKKTDLFKTVIPTKMLEFMSCARPVILGVDGQARMILEEARGGLVIEPENSDALVHAIRLLAANPDQARELGHNGREYIVRKFSRGHTAEKYIRVLEQLLNLPERSSPELAA
ncbi:MAG TPA: glycosyltransferase family 4 protein [Candidatus Dormibacteraeota bacterium]|jgi:colanic acid biosynthesis glycosyl transferase WcaI|nr:glycosyltransferase family 4 protein [Candidatus Dormibacteraeota bacterium]